TQFDDDVHKLALEKRAEKIRDGSIEKTSFGLRPTWPGMLGFILPTVPSLPLFAIAFGPWSVVSALPLLVATPALSRWIHPYLHQNRAMPAEEPPWWVAWLLRTTYFRAVARHHFLHHKYPDCNFNLLLGGDWLLGVHRSPSHGDIEE